MTKPKRYKRYSAEFKREAILRASEEGNTDKAVCEELGISTRQFLRWRDELQLLGDDAFPGQTPPHNDFAIFINAMDLENRLRDIQSNCPDLFHCSPPG